MLGMDQAHVILRIEGAAYSVPPRWARLRATPYIGVDEVRILCMGESVTHRWVRFATRQVKLSALSSRAGEKAAGGASGRGRVARRV